MKKIKIDLDNIKEKDIQLIINYYRNGKVIAHPSDTIYGLGCLVSSSEAINKIYKIKKRKNNPLLVLVDSYDMLKNYAFFNKKQEKYLRSVWKKGERPTTVVLKKKKLLSNLITNNLDSIAVRIPQNIFLIRILKAVKEAIVSTSLNISGKKNLENLEKIDSYFEILPDLLVDAGIVSGFSSRLIDIRDIDNIKIVRD